MRALAVTLAVLLAASVSTSCAQAFGRHQHGSDQKQAGDKSKVDEQAYRRALGALPDKKSDPWAGVR